MTLRRVTNPMLLLGIRKTFYRKFHTYVIHMGSISLSYFIFPLVDVNFLSAKFVDSFFCSGLLPKLKFLLFYCG